MLRQYEPMWWYIVIQLSKEKEMIGLTNKTCTVQLYSLSVISMTYETSKCV